MSRNARPHYRPGLGWILGVAFEDTLTRPVRLAQGFTFVRCHGSPRASSPHGLTAPGLASLDGIAACSCLWLAVATNTPREGLSPPIQCPCQAHLPTRRHATAIDAKDWSGIHLSKSKRCSDQPGHLSEPTAQSTDQPAVI